MIDIFSQTKLYFDTIHDPSAASRKGLFQFAPQSNLHLYYNEKPENCVSKINSLLNKYRKNSIFCSLNYFKQISEPKNLRRAANLWGIDCIMIDIDGPKELCGKENDVYLTLKWAWEKNKIPQPNLISYTGGGGLHLYYAFEYLPSTMKSSIQALKWKIVSLIVPYEESFPYIEDKTYKVDTRVLDTQRMDRVPGSINPKTGKLCFCFSTGKERYTYKELLDIVSPDEKYSGKISVKKSKNDILFFRNKNSLSDSYRSTCGKNKKKKSNYKKFDAKALAYSRLNNIIKLAENGKKFEDCREITCFIARTLCYQLNYSEDKEKELLLYLNEHFYEPLSKKELFNNTRVNKIYSFTNNYIISALNISENEMKIFCPNYRPRNRKEKTKEHKMKISLLVLKGFKIKDIAKRLNISESIVKRRRTEIKKAEGFMFWVKKFKELYNFKRKSFKIKRIFSSSKKSSFCKYINNSLNSYKKFVKRKFFRSSLFPLSFYSLFDNIYEFNLLHSSC